MTISLTVTQAEAIRPAIRSGLALLMGVEGQYVMADRMWDPFGEKTSKPCASVVSTTKRSDSTPATGDHRSTARHDHGAKTAIRTYQVSVLDQNYVESHQESPKQVECFLENL